MNRRTFLHAAGATLTAAALLPVVNDQAAASTPDPDELFDAGWFAAADRGYARLLHRNPANAHALAQRGYLALLSNRFRDAERFLTDALNLAPDDTFSRRQLADCYVRQDQLTRAVPLLRDTGNDIDAATAEQYAAMSGIPYQISGSAATRLPMVAIDPLPTVEASANGSPVKPYFLDTGATFGLTQEAAEELGLRAVATSTAQIPGHTFTQSYGVLESLRLGEIELRNVPTVWNDAPRPSGGTATAGTIGTTIFYHFLTTMDYAGGGLVLRRTSRRHAAIGPFGAHPLPLWLADGHFPCTLGSLNDFGPRVVSFDTGGSTVGIATTEEIAQEAGIVVDHEHLTNFNGMLLPSISPDKISLGNAVGRHVPGIATSQLPGAGPNGFRFHTIANFSHKFFKAFAITMDFERMNLYITGPRPDRKW